MAANFTSIGFCTQAHFHRALRSFNDKVEKLDVAGHPMAADQYPVSTVTSKTSLPGMRTASC